jgi:hypothetical protein
VKPGRIRPLVWACGLVVLLSRLRYYQLFAPKIVQRIPATAPTGGDVTSWRY